eukprot:TRINITY_DN3026_c0_g1_i3.p1 TRINITY_DN3026_c0_g1~~TRINITY_DN3026_c0_g1_i3.p1  ORF type:complete len:685 (+),score=126.29 TRINITY_DN3026_c0_g1_i3:36-2057(+)
MGKGGDRLVFVVVVAVAFVVLAVQYSQSEVTSQINQLEKRMVELQKENNDYAKGMTKLLSSLKAAGAAAAQELPPATTIALTPRPTQAGAGLVTEPKKDNYSDIPSRYCTDLSPIRNDELNIQQADEPWDTMDPNLDAVGNGCKEGGVTCKYGTCSSGTCKCPPGSGGKFCDFKWADYLFSPVTEVFDNPIDENQVGSIQYLAMTSVPKGATMIADIGSGIGLSTASLARNLHKNGDGGFILAVDTWTGSVSEWSSKNLQLKGGHPHIFDKFYETVKKSGVSKYVSPFAVPEATASRFFKLRPSTKHFDLIRISQDFSPDETFDAIRNWWPLLRVGGIVQGSSLSFVRSVLTALAKVIPCDVRFIGNDWQIKKLSHQKVCLQNPSQLRLRESPTWVTNWQCIESECNGGSCDGDRCSCPIGKGGQRCEISTKWHGDDDPFADKPLSKYAEGSTSGWHGGLENFRDIFNEIKINTAIDVGVWMGQSSITMAKLLKQQGKGGILISVDPWCGSVEHWRNGGEGWNGLLLRDRSIPMIFERYRSNVIREQVEPFVLPFPVGGHVAAQIFSNLKLSADIVHVDGSHEYEDVVVDLRDWWPIVRPGGVLYGDDYSWRGVAKAVEEFRELHGAKVSIYGPGKEKGLADCRACKFAIHKPLTEPKHPFVPEIITFGDIKS